MASKYSRKSRREALGFLTYEDWSQLPIRAMQEQADKVFSEANKRIRSLKSVRKFDPTDLPAVKNLYESLGQGSFPVEGKVWRNNDNVKKVPSFGVQFKRAKNLNGIDMARAYQTALAFVTAGSSDVSSGRRMKEQERTNIANVLKVASQFIDMTYSEDRDLFYDYKYLENYRDVKLVKGEGAELFDYTQEELSDEKLRGERRSIVLTREIKDNPGNFAQRKIQFNDDDDIYSIIGRTLTGVNDLLSDLDLNGSPEVGTQNANDPMKTRFIDILASYLFFKPESMNFEKMLNEALDEFIDLARKNKESPPESPIGGRASQYASDMADSRNIERGRRKRDGV